MRDRGPRANCAALALLVASGCSQGGTRDASVAEAGVGDASAVSCSVGEARQATASSGAATLRFSWPSARIELRRTPGEAVLAETPGRPSFEVGYRTGGPDPLRLHDPRIASPPDIEWTAPSGSSSHEAADGGISRVELCDRHGGTLRVELRSEAPGVVALDIEATHPDATMLRVNLPMDDGVYHGLGERFGAGDARGQVVPLQLHIAPSPSGTNELHVPVPFVVSSRAYGVFAETHEAGAFDLGASDPRNLQVRVEGRRLRMHFFVGASALEVVAAYTRLTRLPRLPPWWSFGPMQWRNEWRDRDELLGDARRLRELALPTSTIWIDNPWQASYSDHVVDERRFSDPAELLRTLQGMGYRVLFWSVPYLDAVADGASPQNEAERLWVQARDRDWLVRASTGRPYVTLFPYGAPAGMRDATGSPIDFTSRDASDFWTERLRPLIQLGARAFKLDYAEDIVADIAGIRPRYRFSNGTSERDGRWFYPQGYHRAYRAALDRYAGGDGFVMGRASSWGGQSLVDIIWPGDLDNDFSAHAPNRVGGLPAAIRGMIALSMSAFPSFASDTGGYRGGRPPREVLLRWAEHTALSPFMQLGGGGPSHNPWEYDPEAVTLYRGLAGLHTSLVPYLYLHASRASRDGTPVVRPVSLEFPTDVAARSDDLAYLLGPHLLVAPVVIAGATRRRVHIPEGQWAEWFSGRLHVGPTDVEVDATLGRPCVFLRRGAVIPMLRDGVQSLSASTDANLSVAGQPATHRVRIWNPNQGPVMLPGGIGLNVTRRPNGDTVIVIEGVLPSAGLELVIEHRDERNGLPYGSNPARVEMDGSPLERSTAVGAATCRNCWHYDPPLARLVVRVDRGGTLTLTP